MNTSHAFISETTFSAEITKIKVFLRKFSSLDEISKIADFSGIHRNVSKNHNKILNLFSYEEREVILYWEGEDQRIPADPEEFKEYFDLRGYDLMLNDNFSILFNTIKILSEKFLEEIRLPSNTSIMFITPDSLLLDGLKPKDSFLKVQRILGKRDLVLSVRNIKEENDHKFFYDRKYAFLLQKKQVNNEE